MKSFLCIPQSLFEHTQAWNSFLCARSRETFPIHLVSLAYTIFARVQILFFLRQAMAFVQLALVG